MVRENTPYIGLIKPDSLDQYNIKDFNDNSDTIDSRFQLVENDAQTKANTGLTNLSESGQAILDNKLNKDQITNCILEAPNGIYEVINDGASVKIKAGLKALMPNGLNPDGTLNNIIYKNDEDFIFNTLQKWGPGFNGRFDLFLDNNKIVGIGKLKYQDYLPHEYSGEFVLVYQFNQLYNWDANSQAYKLKKTPFVCIGRVVLNNGLITQSSTIGTTSILKTADLVQLSELSLPSLDKISMILAASGTIYTAQNTGWIVVSGVSTNVIASIHLTNLSTGYEIYSPSAYNASLVTAIIPVVVGNKFQLNWINVNIQKFLLIYAGGTA